MPFRREMTRPRQPKLDQRVMQLCLTLKPFKRRMDRARVAISSQSRLRTLFRRTSGDRILRLRQNQKCAGTRRHVRISMNTNQVRNRLHPPTRKLAAVAAGESDQVQKHLQDDATVRPQKDASQKARTMQTSIGRKEDDVNRLRKRL